MADRGPLMATLGHSAWTPPATDLACRGEEGSLCAPGVAQDEALAGEWAGGRLTSQSGQAGLQPGWSSQIMADRHEQTAGPEGQEVLTPLCSQ